MTTQTPTQKRQRKHIEREVPHERLHGGNLHRETWTNAKAAVIGFKTGQGRTSTVIAAELADGTNPASIRAMWKKWGFPYAGDLAPVQVRLSKLDRSALSKRANAAGITPEQWLENIAKFATRDDMYRAIVED